MMHEMLSHIQGIYESQVRGPKLSTQIDILLEGVRSKQYQPLMTRPRCGRFNVIQKFDLCVKTAEKQIYFFAESLENRIAHFAKRRRIEVSKNDEDEE